MWLDEFAEFADAAALDTTGTDEDLIGDVIDLGAAGRDPGNGEPLYLVVQITTAVTSAGAATVAFQLVSDSVAAIAKDGSQSYHVISKAFPKATLVAGYEIVIPIPPGGGGSAYERYLGVQSVTGVAALTAGAVNAFLTKTPQVAKSYADAVN